MTIATLLFLVVRAAHVLLAAVWVGATFFITFYLLPSLEEAGAAGAPVMGALTRRKLPAFQASLGGTAVLTGLYLYYRFTGGFAPALSATRGAMVFGAGGVAGIAALIIGAAVVGRNARRMSAFGMRLAAAPAGERAALESEMAAARRRAAAAARLVIALQLVAVALMAIGHYV